MPSELVLLGGDECGKTTIFKQFQLLHGSSFEEETRKEWVHAIHLSLQRSMKVLAPALEQFGQKLAPGVEAACTEVLSQEFQAKRSISAEMGAKIKAVFMDPAIQAMIVDRTQSRKLDLDDNALYFLRKLDELCAPGYLPTIEDILKVRDATLTVGALDFQYGQAKFRVIDRAGACPTNWNLTDDVSHVSAVIFVLALDEYDQKLRDDVEQNMEAKYGNRSKNRLHESLRLFDVACNRLYPDKPILLVLNKVDLFKEKIEEKIDLKVCFPTYKGGCVYDHALKYIKWKFMNVRRDEPKKIYIMETTATDIENMELKNMEFCLDIENMEFKSIVDIVEKSTLARVAPVTGSVGPLLAARLAVAAAGNTASAGALELLSKADAEEVSELLLTKDDKGKSKLLELMHMEAAAETEAERSACAALVDKLCALNAKIKAEAESADMFLALAKPLTAGAALRLIEEKGFVVSDEIIARMSAGQAQKLEKVDAGKEYSRNSAQELCEERGGRLAYRSEIVDETAKKLIINEGKPMDGPYGHTWTAVLDGDPANDCDGVGWVQLGVGDGEDKVGQNHTEIHHGDNRWGGPGVANGIKCRFIWCMIKLRPLDSLVLYKAPTAIKLVDYLLGLSPTKLVPTAIVVACTPAAAATALKLLNTYPSITLDAAAIEPLFAEENERLTKLVLDESEESRQLITVLMAKSAPIRAAVTSVEMLRTVLPSSAARLLVLTRAEKGDGAVIEAIEAVGKADKSTV